MFGVPYCSMKVEKITFLEFQKVRKMVKKIFFLKFWMFLRPNNLEAFLIKQNDKFSSFFVKDIVTVGKNQSKLVKNCIFQVAAEESSLDCTVGRYLKLFLVLSMYILPLAIVVCCPNRGVLWMNIKVACFPTVIFHITHAYSLLLNREKMAKEQQAKTEADIRQLLK